MTFVYFDIQLSRNGPVSISDFQTEKPLKTMSSPGSYAKGYVRWTAGGKRVMWDGNRWQQLCQIDKCLRRDQKSHGVCLLHFREMQENKAKNKSKKLKINTKVPIKKERKSLNSSKTKRSKRMKTNRK